MNSRYKIIICVILVLTIFISGCNLFRVNEDVDRKLVIAKVNGQEILKGEYLDILEKLEINTKQSYRLDELDEEMMKGLKEQALDQVITKAILMQKVDEMKIELTQENLDEIENVIESYIEQQGGREEFEAWLLEIGYTIEEFQKDGEEHYIIQNLFDEITKDIEATEKDMKAYYEEYKETSFTEPEMWDTRHILIALADEDMHDEDGKPKETIDEAAYEKIKGKAEEVLAKVKAGEDFVELAKEFSEDPGTKEQGGLYVVKKGDATADEYKEATEKLKVGEVTELVKTRFGYHIIKLDAYKPEKIEEFENEEIQEYIKEQVLREKRGEVIEQTVEKWKEESKIEKFEKNL